MNKLATIFGAVLLASASRAQEFQYQFQDKPTPEANVMVVSYDLKTGSGADSYLVGRLFYRGQQPARNVRILYIVRNLYGASLPTAPYHLNPPDIPATSFADFET
jgi:hypothetical protein